MPERINRRSVDETDVERFARIGEDWWDAAGPMRALHQVNPVRIAYVRDLLAGRLVGRDPGKARPLEGLRVLDIGCGGGLLSEPLARLGARVTAIDPAAEAIAVASRHAEAQGLTIAYRVDTAENLAASGATFDAVLAMEVVEHVTHMRVFVKTACAMVRHGGLFVSATLNRTVKSFALAIVGAEYVLGWIPRGTHQWEKFVTPEELEEAIRKGGLDPTDRTGVVYNPLFDEWSLSRDTGVNYMVAAERRG